MQPRAKITVALLACLALAALASCGPPPSSIDLGETARLGKAGAPVKIVVYSDFQCPFCKRAAAELNRIAVRQGNRVRVYFKHFPLDRHPQARNAAHAAEAARLQGKFWEMHDQLFAHGMELTDNSYAAIAAEVGLDVERFEHDRQSPETAARVAADKAEGEALGVDGTPYFIVNDVPFHGSYADLGDRIDGLEGAR